MKHPREIKVPEERRARHYTLPVDPELQFLNIKVNLMLEEMRILQQCVNELLEVITCEGTNH